MVLLSKISLRISVLLATAPNHFCSFRQQFLFKHSQPFLLWNTCMACVCGVQKGGRGLHSVCAPKTVLNGVSSEAN